MKSLTCKFLTILFALVTMNSCDDSDSTTIQFDGERAYSHLVKQVEFGPRVPGSAAWQNCRNYYYEYFSKLGVEIDSQVFEFIDPYSNTKMTLVNVVVNIKGKDTDKPGVLLMAHYDSRPRTDFPGNPEIANRPIDGANDGASGVAVLMELGKLLTETPPPYDVELVLVDGEDWGESGDNEYYLLGSQEFARRGIRNKYQFAVVIDMIGDSSQQIYRESFSESFHPKLNQMIWDTAKQLKVNTFIDSTVYTVLDDHVSLATSGVPAVVLIDFDYPYWHTENDTPDKCSPQSLENVGKVLLYLCYNPSLWP